MSDRLPPEIHQKLRDDTSASLRNYGLTEEQIAFFMKEHDRILEEFLRKLDARDQQ